MRTFLLLLFSLPLGYCFGQAKNEKPSAERLNRLATDYVRLGLSIGAYDGDFVDAYYGPDSLKPATVKQASFPKDSFLRAVGNLQAQLQPYITKTQDASLSHRARWMNSQLTAFGRRIKMFSGEKSSFDQQAKDLFGVQPPSYDEGYFRSLLKQLDKLLPGEGSVSDRFQLLGKRFVIPKDKLDTLIKLTIAESKKRTERYFTLPKTEEFRLEFVSGKPWSGYNWYQGNYASLIQFNSDITTFIDKIIDVASHEGYPGHHVYNSLLEEHLYKEKGWTEISLYPLFSPQSLIAEGSANYGIEMAFPGEEKVKFAKEHLLPVAGLDTTGLTTYFQALAIKGALQAVRTEVTRRMLDGKMSDSEALRWLTEYGLLNEKDAALSLSFSKKYQSYVINYTYGMNLVKNYIGSQGGTEKNTAKRWALFQELLSDEVLPVDLLKR